MDLSLIKQSPRGKMLVTSWLARLPSLDEQKLMELISACYEKYISGTKTLRVVALEHNLPVALLLDWAKAGKWQERRIQFREELLVAVETDFAEFIQKKRVDAAGKLVDGLLPSIAVLSEKLTAALAANDSIAARRYAEAIKLISDVVMQSSGLNAPLPTSAPAKEEEAADSDTRKGKQPWFNVNASGPVTVVQGAGERPAEQPIKQVWADVGPVNRADVGPVNRADVGPEAKPGA